MSGIPAGAGSLLGKRLGKYEILALLALGGTAEIYLARIGGAAGFEKYVVVKCLHDHLADDTEFVKMFLDEARLAAHLDHSNIVQTMELGEHENRYYMVMEFLAGLSLAMVVRRAGERMQGGQIPVPLVLNIVAQSCAGLHYAHERVMNGKPLNIVHRDISPQNLVISFEGVVKVVDFGIAKAELRETRTRSGTIKGKFAYMSPEQCVANNVDRRTDVFALGVIAHELLTGRRLFKKPSPYETYQAVIECAVEPPSKVNVEIDPAIDEIIMRAIAKDKERRYPTAEAFGDALLGYLHHRGKNSGPGEVSRFFDASFAQEIDEHGARMRELIAGRDIAAEAGVNWGEEEEEKKGYETVDLGPKEGASAANAETEIHRPSSGSLSEVLGDLDELRRDDDDLPAERTRIEANPLEKVNAMEAEQLRAAAGRPPHPQARPSQPTVAAKPMPPSGALPLPPAPVPGISSGRFPDLANLPTMIAEPDEEGAPETQPVPRVAPELARTQLGGPIVDPVARTAMDMQAPMVNGTANRPSIPSLVQPPPQPYQPPPQPPRPASSSQPMPPMGGAMPAGGPPPRPSMPPVALGPGGYPVMDKQLSAHIAAGATVFPSELGSGPHDSQRAADLMSPVGGQYPGEVDWAAAAAAPARALPPWMLAALFVAALGAALLITIVIAKIVR